MKRRSIVFLAALATTLATAVPAATSAENTLDTDAEVADFGSMLPVERGEFDSYIVVMKADPLVVTEGQDNLQTSRATNRGNQKKAKHKEVLDDSGVSPDTIMSDYVYAVDGFAANVTYDQAVQIANHKDVAMVLPDQLMQPMTDSSPDFLGLSGPAAPWTTGVTGKGVVVGVIDSGIWPEHPSFADNGLPAPPIPALQDLVVAGPNEPYEISACDFGNSAHNPNDVDFTCNNKLVGARQVLPAYRQLIGATSLEFDSARDDNGHGTHTASTAAGNAGVEASVLGNDLGVISGIAPDAHVIMYKGLGTLGGFGSDLALAIDIAVFDGVDVINYSIGGGGQSITVDELSFLFAADAGVHVATSAGNSGPGAATIGNPAKVPWLTTVGASTQDRFWEGTIELGDGTVLTGSSVTQATDGPVKLVDAADAGDPLCRLGTLDPDVVEGAVVLCLRGAPARVMTSAEVLAAGGAGVILYNATDTNNLYTDSFHLPTVMVDNSVGLQVKAYIDAAGDGAIAEIRDTATESTWPSAPSMAIFSSRGPNVFGDVIKPDVTAPGFQILAGNSPFPGPIIGGTVPQVQGELFQSIAGTSMSSPHVAGLFALIDQVHPDWTPAQARSALMTTAHQDVVDNDRVSLAGPFAQGAGHVDPGNAVHKGSAFQPGLAYDAGINDYFGFLCDAFPGVFANPEGTCAGLEAGGVPIVASDLNYPSIAVDEVPGSITVTRTVTSVAKENGNRRYTADIEAPAGYSVSVSPSSFTLKKGQSQTFEVTITNQSAPLGEWRFGSLSWNDQTGNYSVHSPIAVKGSPLAAPSAISVSGTDGSSSVDVQFGYSGPYVAAAHGFAADTGASDSVAQDPDQTCQCDGAGGPGEVAHGFAVADSAHLRIAMDVSDLPGGDPNTDIDLFLFRDGVAVASSTSGGTDEIIDIPFPADGNYTLFVHGWSVPDGVVNYEFHLWDLPATPNAGSLTIDSAPAAAVIGTTGTVEFSWSGLAPGETYLGAISHETGLAPLQLTLIEGNT